MAVVVVAPGWTGAQEHPHHTRVDTGRARDHRYHLLAGSAPGHHQVETPQAGGWLAEPLMNINSSNNHYIMRMCVHLIYTAYIDIPRIS